MERIKNKERQIAEKFSSDDLFKRIEASNLGDVRIESYTSDGEIRYEPGEKLNSALREIGSDSIDYKMFIYDAKRVAEDAVLLTSGISATILSTFFQDGKLLAYTGVLVLAVGSGKFFYEMLARKATGSYWTEEVESQKKMIRLKLLALNLPVEYVDKNFRKIIDMFAKREKAIREEELIMSIPKEEDEIQKARESLGLSEPEKETSTSLEELVANHNHNE